MLVCSGKLCKSYRVEIVEVLSVNRLDESNGLWRLSVALIRNDRTRIGR